MREYKINMECQFTGAKSSKIIKCNLEKYYQIQKVVENKTIISHFDGEIRWDWQILDIQPINNL